MIFRYPALERDIGERNQGISVASRTVPTIVSICSATYGDKLISQIGLINTCFGPARRDPEFADKAPPTFVSDLAEMGNVL